MNFLVIIFQVWSKNWKKCIIHDQFSVTSFTVSVKLWHIKRDFSTSFKITLDERFFTKYHASFWNHPRWEHFHFFLWNWHFGSMKLTNIFTFLCETVKQIHFFLWNCERLIFFAENDFNYVFQFGHEILWSVLCKKWGFSCKPHLFLFFIVAQFHVKTGWNWWFFFCFIWLKKWNWLMVSWVKLA